MHWLRMMLVGVGCTAVLFSAELLGRALAPAPLTLEGATAAALWERGIPFRRVSLEAVGCIPAPENCQSYSGDIVVIDERPARGRIVCREAAQGCALWIAELDLRGVPVPDPAIPGTGGVAEAIIRQVGELRARILLYAGSAF
jgi:hypothetical protein